MELGASFSIYGTIKWNKLVYAPWKIIRIPKGMTLSLDSTSEAAITGQLLRGSYKDKKGGYGGFSLTKTN